MSWETLAPSRKTSGAPMVSAYLKKSKNGVINLVFSLSPFITDMLGDPETLDVDIGRGEHEGMMRLYVDGDGKHRVGKGMKGFRRLSLPHFDGLPTSAAMSEACPVIKQSGDELIVRLPIVEWEVAISRGGQTLRKAPIKPDPSLPPVPASAAVAPAKFGILTTRAGKFDMVKYLQSKSASCKRVTAGQFVLEGHRVGPAEMLELVNSHRGRADLPPLGLDEVE